MSNPEKEPVFTSTRTGSAADHASRPEAGTLPDGRLDLAAAELAARAADDAKNPAEYDVCALPEPSPY